MNIPPDVKKIMDQIETAGYEVYIVGGSIRDQLLNKETKDYDLATSAEPNEIKKIFENDKIMDYGEKHGTIAIYRRGRVYEITTYRVEEGYTDGRRPDSVKFVKQLNSDLSRRDFTINAIAMNKNGEIIDPHGGIKDFNEGVIRAVGDPVDRFREDSLRMLRAVRFASNLDFKIEKSTFLAIKSNCDLLSVHKISGERILNELKEIIINPGGFSLLHKLNLLQVILPEIYKNNVIEQIKKAFSNREKTNKTIPWAIIFHYITRGIDKKSAKIDIERIMMSLPGLGNNFIQYVTILAVYTKINEEFLRIHSNASIYRWIAGLKKELVKIKKYQITDLIEDLFKLNELCYQLVIDVKNYYKLKSEILRIAKFPELNLPVDGHDAKKIGYKGNSIARLITQWKLMYRRNPDWKKDDLYLYADLIKNNYVLESGKIREDLSENQPLFTTEENDAVIKEINRLNRLIRSQNNICIMCINYQEYLSSPKSKLKDNNLFIVQDILFDKITSKDKRDQMISFNMDSFIDILLEVEFKSDNMNYFIVSDDETLQKQVSEFLMKKLA